MASYRYYLIPDAMTLAFPERFETPTPREFFDSTADLKRRYLQLSEQPYNNEPTYNERTKLSYVRLEVGIERKDPNAALAVMQVRGGVNYLCDDYRSPFADRDDSRLLEMAKQLVETVGVDRVRPHLAIQRNGDTKILVGNDMHITDWLFAEELCGSLQFSRFLNRDGQQLFQVRDGERIIENYADGTRQLHTVRNIDCTHIYVGHYGCHIQQYADANFKSGCYVTPEHPQPGDNLDRLQIYQITADTDYRFMRYSYAKNRIRAADYSSVYLANLPRDYDLERCFREFNAPNRPCSRRMHSLSVSDIVVIEQGGKEQAVYVDSVGFQEVSHLLPELHDLAAQRQKEQVQEEPER